MPSFEGVADYNDQWRPFLGVTSIFVDRIMITEGNWMLDSIIARTLDACDAIDETICVGS